MNTAEHGQAEAVGDSIIERADKKCRVLKAAIKCLKKVCDALDGKKDKAVK